MNPNNALESPSEVRQYRQLTILRYAQMLAQNQSILAFHGRVKRVASDQPSARIQYLCDLIKRSTIEWLAREGGFRTKTVALRKRRVTGRLWDQGVWSKLNLSFSDDALKVLLHSYEWRSGQEKSFQMVAGQDLQMGDVIFRHLVLMRSLRNSHQWGEFWQWYSHRKNADRVRQSAKVDPNEESKKTRRKTKKMTRDGEPKADSDASQWEIGERASPLTRLLNSDQLPLEQEDIELLQGPEFSVLISYLDKHIAKAWLAAEIQRDSRKASTVQDHYQRQGDFFEAWLKGAEERERYDLLLPVGEYFRRLMRHFGPRDKYLKHIQQRVLKQLVGASDREQFMRSLGRIFKVGERLQGLFEDVRTRSYVERSASDHIFLAGYHDIYSGVASDIRVIGRHLLGEIG